MNGSGGAFSSLLHEGKDKQAINQSKKLIE